MKKTKRKITSFIKLLFSFSLIIFSLFLNTNPVKALSGWDYRRPITIDNTSNGSSLSNYQVKVDVSYDSNMNSDFSDLRFTDSDGETELDYWIENYTSSTSATVWVMVSSIPASSNKTIYMYYGNSGASTTSSGENTFMFFDDFGTDTLNQYTSYGDTGPWAITNGYLEVSDTDSSAYSFLSYPNLSFTNNESFAIDSRIYLNGSAIWGGFLIFSDNSSTHHHIDVNNNRYSDRSTSTANGGSNLLSQNTWHNITLEYNANTDTLTWFKNGSQVYSDPATGTSGTSSGTIGFISNYHYNSTRWDYIRVRKYTSTEPTISVGSEELADSAPSAPTGLQTNGQTNPTELAVGNPYFSATYNGSPADDIANYYQIQVSEYSDFSINTNTYDFSSCSSGSNCWAYEKGDSQPTNPSDYTSQAASGDYTNISASNDTRWITSQADITDTEYDSQVYTFTITENVIDISQIDIEWQGYGETQPGYTTYLKVWNNNTSSWDELNDADYTSASDTSLTGSKTSSINNYIDENSKIHIMVTSQKYLAEESSYCSDGLDNDNDGCTDGVDSDCGGTESNCSDGIDNDCDGVADLNDNDCCNALAETCSTNEECCSGYCEGGYCCSSTCTSDPCTDLTYSCNTDDLSVRYWEKTCYTADCSSGTCQQVPNVESGNSTNTCNECDPNNPEVWANVAAGTDPYNQCTEQYCNTGLCDGSGSCNAYNDSQKHGCNTCYVCSDNDVGCEYAPAGTADAGCDPVDDRGERCYTGYCRDWGSCDTLDSGEGLCPACESCTGGSYCDDAVYDDVQDTTGPNTCDVDHKYCSSGTCYDGNPGYVYYQVPMNNTGTCDSGDPNQYIDYDFCYNSWGYYEHYESDWLICKCDNGIWIQAKYGEISYHNDCNWACSTYLDTDNYALEAYTTCMDWEHDPLGDQCGLSISTDHTCSWTQQDGGCDGIEWRCDDGTDNDADFKTDCSDSDCASDPACQ